jgi:hypothetical protein
LKVGITLGSKAHSLLALDTTCIKYIKYWKCPYLFEINWFVITCELASSAGIS